MQKKIKRMLRLLLSKIMMDSAKKQKKNLCMSWIDYKKAFDSLPHTWIIEILQTYKISSEIIAFIKSSMGKWKTNIKLYYSEGELDVNNIAIKRGIFQGAPYHLCYSA